jgi:hypothetical protein
LQWIALAASGLRQEPCSEQVASIVENIASDHRNHPGVSLKKLIAVLNLSHVF